MDESTLRVCVSVCWLWRWKEVNGDTTTLHTIRDYTHAVQLFLACPFPSSLPFFLFWPFSFHWNGADSQGEKSRPDKGEGERV
jgi:hypothetical protein